MRKDIIKKQDNKDFPAPLEIKVTKSFPFNRVLSIHIKKGDKSIFDRLELNKDEATYLQEALHNILGELDQGIKKLHPKDVDNL